MIITTIEDAILALKSRLPDYLEQELNIDTTKHFKCVFHNDGRTPNMKLNSKTSNETAHCFSCQMNADIFTFANKLESMPVTGAEFITVTLPALAKRFNLQLSLGEPSEIAKLRAQYMRMASDIRDILDLGESEEYISKRKWSIEHITAASIPLKVIVDSLLKKGWNEEAIKESHLLGWYKRDENDKPTYIPLFGEELFTICINDPYKRPIGFIARSLNPNAEKKYIHSLNSIIFNKGKTLFGLHVDMELCRKEGIYIVEGPGELLSMHRIGKTNVACIMGTALTEDHLLELKKHKIRNVILSLDWDEAGIEATSRIVETVVPKVQDISVSILEGPNTYKDIDEYLFAGENFEKLTVSSVFDWKFNIVQKQYQDDIEAITKIMVPLIAAEPSAVKRNLLIQRLSQQTGILYTAIDTDVEAFRNVDERHKEDAIKAVIQTFYNDASKDPTNAISLIASLEQEIDKVHTKHDKGTFGINYQVSRYKAIQEVRNEGSIDNNNNHFSFSYYKEYGNNMMGGMPTTRGSLSYFGGSAHHGKTLLMIGLGTDVALHDDNATVIIHSIDDSYEQIEPRIKTNLYNMHYRNSPIELTIGHANEPWRFSDNELIQDALIKANELFLDLLSREKLVLLDATDGKNLSLVERSMRYYRNKFPSKKMLVLCDNTHDYEDYPAYDQNQRMKLISSKQKDLTAKYQAAIYATVEYRKRNNNGKEMVLPTNDEIADSRSMSYKPTVITHVYNDLVARGPDLAEIFWKDKYGNKQPRLKWYVSKNKLNSYKGSMALDIQSGSVMAKPYPVDKALAEWKAYMDAPEDHKLQAKILEADLGFEKETEYEE